MDMDHLIGQRFNLISKSEIRYVGTLHEINPEQSTIALENVYSFGTEGRPAENFIPASNQKFDYIVFRGSDVKDIKVVEEQKENQQPEPAVPNDPAILNASRPSQSSPRAPQNPPPFPEFPQHPPFPRPPFQGYYPQYDRQYGPPPGGFPPNFPGMPYPPPPPGYFGPPVQGFPPNGSPFPPPMPIGALGQRPPQQMSQGPNELPVNDRAHPSGQMRSPSRVSTVSPPPGPTPPIDSKPSVSEALAPVATAPVSAPLANMIAAAANKPTVPKGRVEPVIPMMVNNRSAAPLVPPNSSRPLAAASKPGPSNDAAPTQIAMEEANRQARAAVANAMAKMNTSQTPTAQPKPVAAGNPVEILTRKVGEMKVERPRGERSERARGGARGPRGSRGAFNQGRKIEIPKSDYDFESANARFNKEDMIKEAIASGSPIAEPVEEAASLTAAANGDKRQDSVSSAATEVYNKSSSFFDNLSSELKDREESSQHMGRGRGEELKKNLETFGQGSVDGGFRGRGRGFRGRARAYTGQHRGYGGGGYRGGRGRARGGAEQPAQPAQSAEVSGGW